MRGRCSNIVNRVVRSTSVPIADRFSPMIRSPSQCPGTTRSSIGGAGADHDLGCDEAVAALPGASTRHAQRSTGAQASDEFPLQRAAALDVERLVDRLV